MLSCLVSKQKSGATHAPMRLLYLTERKQLMLLDTGTLIAIVIALACSCFVMVVSIRAQGKLIQENNSLRKELTELHYNRVKEGI